MDDLVKRLNALAENIRKCSLARRMGILWGGAVNGRGVLVTAA